MFGSKRNRSRAEGGFSLVETVAAMGILALAAVPLMQVSSDAARNAQNLEARMLARTVAENMLAVALADPVARDAGIQTGEQTQLGRSFEWQILAGPPVPGELQQLEVSVRQSEQEQILASLVALKAIEPPSLAPRPEDAPPESDAEGEEEKE